ncbi:MULTISPECIES: hypothetical protein [Bizionia]|uniref:Lipoprotein n=1 Tax=Bizionia algoritergicola TaxID=291187 RepID=A0A5D0QV44_9FLAO|nr:MULTISPECIES: hypothetical protein [Bizionia]OBX21980.1 hypothetical protein BAA08_10485 [Bizionia sp. APA-3]TYB72288.1 hypothetical protein ES675_11010 [Bizionia algoritergicola]
MKHITSIILVAILFSSCGAHQRSHIKAEEEFVVSLKQPESRGGMVEIALQGLFIGAKYLADQSAKQLTSSYAQSISVNNYYNTFSDKIEKTYQSIEIFKYAKPQVVEEKTNMTRLITSDVNALPKSRGTEGALELKDVIRDEKDDLLNFYAKIDFISDPDNPGVTRISFDALRVFFSKTKVFTDENLNARISISIEGQWRSTDGSPMKKILIEQEYDFKNLKYGADNQITKPILSPWYYDIPITSEIANNSTYGVLKVNVQLEEYEGNKSKYINQLPSILSKNKDAIVKDGASTIMKITK